MVSNFHYNKDVHLFHINLHFNAIKISRVFFDGLFFVFADID